MASEPSIIVLVLWPGASIVEVEGHVKKYQTEFPLARIELLPSKTVSSPYEANEKDDWRFDSMTEPVLIHIFGQQATAKTCSMLRSYYSRTGRTMNVKRIIFDSPPVSPKPLLAQAFLRPYAMLLSACHWVCAPILPFTSLYNESTWVQQDLENPRLLPQSAKRGYLSPSNSWNLGWRTNPIDLEGLRECSSTPIASRAWYQSRCRDSCWTSF